MIKNNGCFLLFRVLLPLVLLALMTGPGTDKLIAQIDEMPHQTTPTLLLPFPKTQRHAI